METGMALWAVSDEQNWEKEEGKEKEEEGQWTKKKIDWLMEVLRRCGSFGHIHGDTTKIEEKALVERMGRRIRG